MFRYDGSNMATTYEQQEGDEDGDPWKDSKLSNGIGNRIPSDLIEKSKFSVLKTLDISGPLRAGLCQLAISVTT